MVTPRVPSDADVTQQVPRPAHPRTPGAGTPAAGTPASGYQAPGRWAPPREAQGRPWGQAPARPAPWGPPVGASQALAADPGPLPFTPTREPEPSSTRRRMVTIGLVLLFVLLAVLGVVGGYALTRSLAGQAPVSTTLAPDGPVVGGVALIDHSDADSRHAGTGLDFTALVPAGWQQFRLQQPTGDVTVRFVSPDASRELRIDQLTAYYPDQRAGAYAQLLADPERIGVETATVSPLEPVGPARPGAGEAPQQTIYRTSSGAADQRTTWTRLIPTATDLWVVRLSAADTAIDGAADQFRAIADSFTPPA